jgi:hypothetical protein
MSKSRRRIVPATPGAKISYPKGGRYLPQGGANISWNEDRKRPDHAHWARYLAMGVVRLADVKPDIPMPMAGGE